jgi:hypothetical protein
MDTRDMTPAQRDRLLNSMRLGKLRRPVASEDAVVMKDAEGNTTELTACADSFKKEAPKARPPAKQIERDPEVKAESQDGSELARKATHRAIERAKERLQSYKEGNQLIDAWTPEKHSLEGANNTPTR